MTVRELTVHCVFKWSCYSIWQKGNHWQWFFLDFLSSELYSWKSFWIVIYTVCTCLDSYNFFRSQFDKTLKEKNEDKIFAIAKNFYFQIQSVLYKEHISQATWIVGLHLYFYNKTRLCSDIYMICLLNNKSMGSVLCNYMYYY